MVIGPIDWPETSVTNYQSILRNIPEEQISLNYTVEEAWYHASFRWFVRPNCLAFTSHLCTFLIIVNLFPPFHKERKSNSEIVFPLRPRNLPCTSSERKDFWNICYLHWHWKMENIYSCLIQQVSLWSICTWSFIECFESFIRDSSYQIGFMYNS